MSIRTFWHCLRCFLPSECIIDSIFRHGMTSGNVRCVPLLYVIMSIGYLKLLSSILFFHSHSRIAGIPLCIGTAADKHVSAADIFNGYIAFRRWSMAEAVFKYCSAHCFTVLFLCTAIGLHKALFIEIIWLIRQFLSVPSICRMTCRSLGKALVFYSFKYKLISRKRDN